MENPHAERQAIILGRIVKNVEKCTEMIQELNHCTKELVQANVRVAQAAELATKYRKNVLYNLEASGLVSNVKDNA
ncbi:hypothetical protein SISNIDRAFT_448740 [Sistotremastrum niveocremeum HHB9708]|uniref:DASH complex subunit DAD4 n=2 Tax=Sistotremastraceae TaxID=3402574 RepID=A0A165A540_9AGAM|nr:hypothetical protein SISNIDRAFT_448740 [Sistotremastrum niveocremeum HHB9708]KZT43579.1 hypothetical protein SISSUDRAFT_1040024 [Sistotremastrum suecicum HHB10207 ss-3]